MTKGLSRGDNMVDARGVKIEPGDAVIYGFGVSRSVAMAEGRVRDDGYGHVSTTPSGRVWVTIVRRSYGGGEEERVHIAPDRMVVLKKQPNSVIPSGPYLPDSPLPTQDEVNRDTVIGHIESSSDDLGSLLAGGPVPEWMRQTGFDRGSPRRTEDEARAWGIAYYRRTLPERLAKLAGIETRIPCCEQAGSKIRESCTCACPCHMSEEELHLEQEDR